jgi:hypothetical protein
MVASARSRRAARRRAPARLPGQRGALHHAQHVLEHGHLLEQPQVLERARDAAQRGAARIDAGERLAAQLDRAGVGREVAGDQVEQRGLAGAVRTDQRGDDAGRQVEVDVVRRDHAAEALVDAREAKDGSGRSQLSPIPPPERGRSVCEANRVGVTRRPRPPPDVLRTSTSPLQGEVHRVRGSSDPLHFDHVSFTLARPIRPDGR